MKKIIFIFTLVIIGNFNLIAQNEIEDIRFTLNQYIKGLKEGDKNLLTDVFDNSAILKSINLNNGSIQNFPVQNFISSTPSGGIKIEAEIKNISFAGSSGQAVVELSFATFKYIDLLSLLKVNGDWKIVARVFSRTELDESVVSSSLNNTNSTPKKSTSSAAPVKKAAPKPKAKVDDDGW
ncbi:MAG: hypothetical protein RIR51_947 [Bacteroidota bacterium]|jgi:hypothetical protein